MPQLSDYNARVRNKYKGFIIIHPIMTGGIVPKSVQQKLMEDEWLRVGYAACFDCIEGRSSLVHKPPIKDFLEDLAAFFNGDIAEHTFGCRAAQFSVIKTVSSYISNEGKDKYADVVLVDSLCHYTTAMAIEAFGLKMEEVKHTGYPSYEINAEDYVEKIEEIRKTHGKLPALIVLTHVEPYYGNLGPAKEIGKIAKEYDVPYMLNAAYTGGIMPIDMKELNVDFLTLSAHKSMASLGPLGFVVTNFEWAKLLFRESKLVGSWSGRIFGRKIPSVFGCSIGGNPIISAMLSFKYVVERTKKWQEELSKTRWFVDEMEKIETISLLGQHPHNHHLLHFETPILYEISKKHKRKGFFLAEELEKRGIVGVQKGLTKHIKLSVYGLSWSDVRRVRDAFLDIIESHKNLLKK